MNMPSQEAGAGAAVPIDLLVADHFCSKCTIFDGVPDGAPFLAANLFGLVYFDFARGELLLPVSSALKLHEHQARIYSMSTISNGTSDGTETTVGLSTVAYWNIKGYMVDWVLLDSSGNQISDAPRAPVKSPHDGPWNNFKHLRNITAVGDKPVLNNRTDPLRVASRVILRGDYIEVGAPYTFIGQFSEWKVQQVNGDVVVGPTSDNLTFIRVLPAQTAAVRIEFTPIGSSPRKDSVELALTNNRLLLAVTHATREQPDDASKLEHTRVFALLLEDGDIVTFPTAEFARGTHGESKLEKTGFISSSDTHCEGGGG